MEQFNIGDRVRIKDYADLPDSFRAKGMAKLCGMEGEIVDMIWSRARQEGLYKIQLDGAAGVSTCDFPEGSFNLLPPHF